MKSYLYGLAGVALATSAQAGVYNATLVEDTYIASTNPGTNFATAAAGESSRFIQIRAVSAATRAGFIQFTLPAIPANEQVTKVELSLKGGAVSADFPDVEILATTSAIDLTTITWNTAISGGFLDGDGREGDYTPDFSNLWTSFASEPFNIDSITTTNTLVYTDTTPASGLLKFVSDIIGAAPQTFTLAFGFATTETETSFVAQFRSTNDNGGAGYAPGGPNGPVLTITTEVVAPVPEPAAAGLVFVTAAMLHCRRRRQSGEVS
jgi:hypothetical protein